MLTRLFRRQYFIALTIVIVLVIIGSSIIEYIESRADLYRLLNEEALALSDAIQRSSENILRATEELELQIEERLLAAAHGIVSEDYRESLTAKSSHVLLEKYSLRRIQLFSQSGTRLVDIKQDTLSSSSPDLQFPLRTILQGKAEYLIVQTSTNHPAILIPRRFPKQGALYIELSTIDYLDLRKNLGIGKLLQDIATNSGFHYVALQDSLGILAASGTVKELSTFGSDPLLSTAFLQDTVLTRHISVHGEQFYEVLHPFEYDGTPLGVIRIALSLDKIHNLEYRMFYRSLIFVLVFTSLLVLLAQAHRYILHSQQALAKAELFTKTLLEHMEDAVVTIDTSGTVTFFNQRAEVFFGIASTSILGKHCQTMLPHLWDVLTKLAADKTPTEITFPLPQGERIVSVALTRIDDRLTAVLRDVTDIKRMEQEIQRQERLSAMGTLAAGVAHEIRNPLNAIAMIIHRLQEEFTPRKGKQDYMNLMDVLKKEIERLNTIIQQFLSFARFPKLSYAEVSLSEFLQHIARLIQPQAQAKGIHFSYECTLDRKASFDPDQMTQALLNVLQNALDATPSGGTVSLRTWVQNQTLYFSVTDTGTGIPKELQTKIFDLYFTTKPAGTGIGLPMASRIVQNHGGTLSVSSVSPKGSLFTIAIPLK